VVVLVVFLIQESESVSFRRNVPKLGIFLPALIQVPAHLALSCVLVGVVVNNRKSELAQEC